MTTRKNIGCVGVDAGLLMVGDPCYFWPDKDGEKTEAVESLENWCAVCAALNNGPGKNDGAQLHFQRGHDGLGVIVETTNGDGCYPVYLETDDNGRRRLIVELD